MRTGTRLLPQSAVYPRGYGRKLAMHYAKYTEDRGRPGFFLLLLQLKVHPLTRQGDPLHPASQDHAA